MKSDAGSISDLYEAVWYSLADLANRNDNNKNKNYVER